jgi:hypothetical protein
MAGKRGKNRDILPWLVMMVIVIAAIVVARRDRAVMRHSREVRPDTIRFRHEGPGTRVANASADMQAAAEDLERAAEEARKAAAELQQVRDEIDKQQQGLEVVKNDADVSAKQTRHDLEEARRQLESQQTALEKASRESEARMRSASADLERLQERQLQQAATAGIAQGMSRTGRIRVPGIAGTNPRRLPSMPLTMPNEAALAAAGGYPSDGPSKLGSAGGMTPLAASRQARAAMNLQRKLQAREAFLAARGGHASGTSSGVSMSQAIRIAAMGVRPRLTPVELDPATGAIAWPSALEDSRYAELTRAIEVQFRQRADGGESFDDDARPAVDHLTDELAWRLKKNISTHPSGTYGAARTFIDKLRQEYGLPAIR